MKILKKGSVLLFVALFSVLLVTLSWGSEGEGKVFVNGKEVSSKQNGFAKISSGQVYVPVETIVKELGGTFKANSTNTTIDVTLKDGKTVTYGSGKVYALVNGELKPFHTKNFTGVNAPSGLKPIIFDGHSSVPTDSITQLFGYPVVVKKDKGLEVHVGKLVEDTKPPTEGENGGNAVVKEDPRYPFPTGWTPPTTKEKSNGNAIRNAEVLARDLGFKNSGNGNLLYKTNENPYMQSSFLIDSSYDADAAIYINVWSGSKYLPDDNKTPYVMKETLKFYLGDKEGEKLYKIVDGIYNSDKEAQKYLSKYNINNPKGQKVFTFGNRQVEIRDVNQLIIFIGKPNEKYDVNWNKKK